jgi:hypothetical protein
MAKHRIFTLTTVFKLIIIFLLSNTIILIGNPLGYSQPEKYVAEIRGLPSDNLSSSSNKMAKNVTVSVQIAGESKFVGRQALSGASVGESSKRMPEPGEPNSTEVIHARKQSELLTHSAAGISYLKGKRIVTVNGSQIEGLLATGPTSNITNRTSAGQSNVVAGMTPRTLSVGPKFGGLNQLQGGAVPPDPTLAVGPQHVIQMVNTAGLIFLKDGEPANNPFRLDSFFAAPGHDIFDPVLIYDKSTGRFFASIVDQTDDTVRIAVSASNNPLDNWMPPLKFRFNTNGNICPDQAFIGVSSDKLVISANLFTPSCRGQNQYSGSQQVIVNKADLLSSNLRPPYVSTLDPSLVGFSMRPVKSFTAGPDINLVSLGPGGNGPDYGHFVKMIKYKGQAPNIQVVGPTLIPIQILILPPGAKQIGTNLPLDPEVGRLQSAYMTPDSKFIWLASMDGCIPKGSSENTVRSCLRLIQIDTNTNVAAQDFPFSVFSPDMDLIYPSLAVSASGDMIVAFGISSENIPPSLAATQEPGGGHSDDIGDVTVITRGLSSEMSNYCKQSCPYGDYQGNAIEFDPTDDHSVWVTGQVMLQSDIWGTFIAKLTY